MQNHTVHVTDTQFEPKVVTIHPGDRVWWIWQEGNKQHNVIQVSHQGNHIRGGFVSGAPTDSPSAFLHQFTTPGVYYYISAGLAKSFGAVVVSSQPRVSCQLSVPFSTNLKSRPAGSGIADSFRVSLFVDSGAWWKGAFDTFIISTLNLQ